MQTDVPPKPVRIVITGAAGLVGQNLATMLLERNDVHLIGIDKHRHNLDILSRRHPRVDTIHADLSELGPWTSAFDGASVVVQLHAQIAGKAAEPFERNSIRATQLVLEELKRARVPYLVHVSSSVVNSVANDHYTDTKKRQEALVRSSGVRHCVLRPTLMYGWFDPKHLGWLGRFMAKVPVFPIPGHGRYLRQPLYARDFCRVIEACIDRQPRDQIYDIAGAEHISYLEILRTIRSVRGLRTPFLHVPTFVFATLLRAYAVGTAAPPFTVDQLKALTAGDDFPGVDLFNTFGVTPTPFATGIRETWTDDRYGAIVLDTPFIDSATG